MPCAADVMVVVENQGLDAWHAMNIYVCKVTEIVLLDSMHTMNKITEPYILQYCFLYVNIKPLSTYVHVRYLTKYFRSKFFFVM